MYIIETSNLSKSYGKNRGIIDINLKIKEGEIFGFVLSYPVTGYLPDLAIG